MADNDDDPFVPITGTVSIHTSLGVFLATQGRRVFIPGLRMEPLPRRYLPGETVTLEVRLSFAMQEGVVPGAKP